ncbi:MAG: MarR family winged helix-turn-helix transcriptional regulator [Thermoleophilaceae bacterium]
MLYADRPPEELAGYSGFLMSFLGEKSRRRFIAALEPLGFHPREFGLMTVLAKRPGITQQELAALARVDPSSMVALLDDLEARGLAERRVDPIDRRRRAVLLTDEGRRQVQLLKREARKALEEFLAPLTAEERQTLHQLLRKLAGLEPS